MNKPSWRFWLIWIVFYTAVDLIITALWYGSFAWGQVRGAIEDAVVGATLTWLFALWKWHKADCEL